uniref:Nudix hydrolase domain-containing protein n=1 Tax=Globisporangium ultimum (strain ATCC 200006 / CBS 805.95 / DAOM BR144) TaxID=431595 RepID=K3WJA9_GLOUD
MHAFRGGLTRALSRSSTGTSHALLANASETRAFASSAKPRLSWRQKQKLEEKKRNPKANAPRQAPREKVARQNFLVTPAVDDGKKWRILSAGILERLPVIQPDLKDYEMDVEMMEHEIALREDQRLDEDFWFMEPGSRHITPEEAPWPNEEQDPEELIGAGFQFAPRETEDDATNNRKSLNRALKGRVFLIVKNTAKDAKFPWFFPLGEAQSEEKMRDAAVRHVAENVGEDLEVTPVGFAPIGYVKYEHPEGHNSEFDGTKVFFYKSQFLTGDVALNAAKAEDYLWVTRDELAEYLDADVAEYVKKIVPN